MKESVLVLSTAHMPSTSPDFGDLRAIPFEYGFVVWVSKLSVPEWMLFIMEHARREGCTLIMFDRDVRISYKFRTWDW